MSNSFASYFEPKNTFFRLFFLLLSGLFVLSGAVNQGFSLFIFAVPFLIWFVFLSLLFSHAVRIMSFCFLILCYCSYNAASEGTNKIFYPYVGSTITLSGEWLSVKNAIIYPKIGEDISGRNLSHVDFNNGTKCIIDAVEVTHPDFTEVRVAMVSCNNKVYEVRESTINEYYGKGIYMEGVSNKGGETEVLLQSEWSLRLSDIMAWPLIFLILFA